MATAYFIGGTPRTGKTTLSFRFLEKRPIRVTCADSLRYMLRELIQPHDKPELFQFAKYVTDDADLRGSLLSDHDKAVKLQTEESAFVWQSIKPFIQSNIDDGFDLLVEGLAIMPAFIKDLNCEHKAVFLGNQSEKHVDTILGFARNNPKDWMHNLSDETIVDFAALNRTYSRFIESEAKKSKFPYIDIHDNSFEADIHLALQRLLA